MAKLFEVTIRGFVVAEDKDEAKMFAGLHDGWDMEAEPATSVPKPWLDAFPFGDNPRDLTCAQWLRKKP